jgi:hypothetical protein
MKRYFIYLALIQSLVSVSLGSEFNDALCEKEATLFGNGSGKDHIPEECLSGLEKKTNAYTFRKSLDGEFTVQGHKNIISINDPKTKVNGQNVISGKSTNLEEITALAIDEVNKEIAVIDGARDVFFFSSSIIGNVAPLRTVKSQDLEGAVDLVINPKKGQLIVLNPATRQIIIISRLANIFALEGRRKLDILKRIGNVDGQYLTMDPEKQELFVINIKTGSILAWDLEDFSFRKINFSLPPSEVKSVRYSLKDESILLEIEKKVIMIPVTKTTK